MAKAMSTQRQGRVSFIIMHSAFTLYAHQERIQAQQGWQSLQQSFEIKILP